MHIQKENERLGLYSVFVRKIIIKHKDAETGGRVCTFAEMNVCIIRLSTYISKLDQPQLSELTNAVIFRAGLQEQLRQAHLLTPKHHLYLPDSQISSAAL